MMNFSPSPLAIGENNGIIISILVNEKEYVSMLELLKSWLNSLWGFATGRALPAIVILAVGILAIRIVMKLIKKMLEKSKLEKTAHNLLRTLVRTVLYVLLVLTAASCIGIDVSGIVALASVLTLAVSLAVQDLLTNLVSGLTLLHTKPFVADDYVEVAGQSGTVKEVGLTYTKLITPDNKIVSIPNSSVVSAEIVNYTVTGTRRVDITISASYDDATDKVLEALKEAAQVPTALEDPAVFVAVSSYGDHAIDYVLRVWSKTEDYWTTHFEVTDRIKKVFDEKGISMTYPHLNVHLDK